MRLVDADALSKLVGEPIEVFLRRLDLKLPPTVDAVEVVRCKDCRFFEDEDYYGNCYCEEWSNITNANGYCHDAERRESEK